MLAVTLVWTEEYRPDFLACFYDDGNRPLLHPAADRVGLGRHQRPADRLAYRW